MIDVEPGIACQHGQKDKLHAAIPLAKRVDRVDLGDEPGRTLRELALAQIPEIVPACQFGEELGRFRLNVLRVAESVVTLARPNRPDIASPLIHVLKKVVVQSLIMNKVKVALRQAFLRPGLEHQLLEIIERILVPNVGPVPQDIGSCVAKWVVNRVIADHDQAFLNAFVTSDR